MKFGFHGVILGLGSLFVGVVGILEAATPDNSDSGKHWAFRVPQEVEVPVRASAESARGPVDAFLQRRLREQGLSFAAGADPTDWLRRLHFKLEGLAPSVDDARAFVEDQRPDARERWIDRLLASPAYGEQRAQGWLDLARFAESDGFEFDHERKEAWRYRDWVVRSFNEDLPYDDFLRFQLAGDAWADEVGDWAAEGTGFLFAGPDMVDINLAEERQHTALCEMTGAVGSAFLGLTLGCAQCHDHRSDPVSLRDYYAFQAFFADTVVDPKKNRQLGPRASLPKTTPPKMQIKVRGDFRRMGEVVEPTFLPVLKSTSLPAARIQGRVDHPRARLAEALTESGNPLVARVLVNRLWQETFSEGLVATPSDFGLLGGRPSHPQLLDWLAQELPRRRWSMKNLHRLLLSSEAFMQASRGRGERWRERLHEDPDNRLLSRASRQRLSGELIRDHWLRVTGKLNRSMGGPGVRPPLPKEVTSTLLKNQWNVTPGEEEHMRRSVYLFVRRNLRFPLFDVFDKPDPNATCARRHVSTTAPQSLTLLNSAFSSAAAHDLASAVQRLPEDERLQFLYWTVFSRPVSSEESAWALELIADAAVPQQAWVDLCLALLNANEAIYVD